MRGRRSISQTRRSQSRGEMTRNTGGRNGRYNQRRSPTISVDKDNQSRSRNNGGGGRGGGGENSKGSNTVASEINGSKVTVENSVKQPHGSQPQQHSIVTPSIEESTCNRVDGKDTSHHHSGANIKSTSSNTKPDRKQVNGASINGSSDSTYISKRHDHQSHRRGSRDHHRRSKENRKEDRTRSSQSNRTDRNDKRHKLSVDGGSEKRHKSSRSVDRYRSVSRERRNRSRDGGKRRSRAERGDRRRCRSKTISRSRDRDRHSQDHERDRGRHRNGVSGGRSRHEGLKGTSAESFGKNNSEIRYNGSGLGTSSSSLKRHERQDKGRGNVGDKGNSNEGRNPSDRDGSNMRGEGDREKRRNDSAMPVSDEANIEGGRASLIVSKKRRQPSDGSDGNMMDGGRDKDSNARSNRSDSNQEQEGGHYHGQKDHGARRDGKSLRDVN